jgi:hypothetical protein
MRAHTRLLIKKAVYLHYQSGIYRGLLRVDS